MAKRYVSSDPTANTAIGNVMKDGKGRPRQRQGRRLLTEFPDIFDGLMPYEIKNVAFEAFRLAGNNVWNITKEHLEQALADQRHGR